MSTSADLTEADIRRYAVPRLAAHIMKSDAKLGEEILNSNNSPYEFSKEGNDPDTYRIDNRVGAESRSQFACLKLCEAVLHIPQYWCIGLPKIIDYDMTHTRDPLYKPFTFTMCRSGKTSATMLWKLPAKRRIILAKDLGRLYYSILSNSTTLEGIPILDPRFRVQPTTSPFVSPVISEGSPVCQSLANSFTYLHDRSSNTFQGSPNPEAWWPVVPELAEEYQQAAFNVRRADKLASRPFHDVEYTLVDFGLGPDCLIVKKSGGRIGEYRPFASVQAQPAFMACRPPVWLWRPQHPWFSDPTQEWELDDKFVESDNTLEVVKKAFDDAAGDLYKKYAYENFYRLARRLAYITMSNKGWEKDFRQKYNPNDADKTKTPEESKSDFQELHSINIDWGEWFGMGLKRRYQGCSSLEGTSQFQY